MKKYHLIAFLPLLFIACTHAHVATSDSAVQAATDRAVTWQMEAYPCMNDMRIYKADGDLSWQNAIFLFSTMEWAAYTGNTQMNDWGCRIAESNAFTLSRAQRIYHADDLVIGSFYARCFDHTGDSAALRPTYERLRYIVEHAPNPSLDLDYAHPETLERWSWCDALFMAPPVFAEYARIFADPELLGYMDHEFWATVDYLYSREDSLFFRDSGYFTKLEANGKPIFWGRGNAWVIAGLARLIPLLPESMRKPYERLFRQMAERLVELQMPDGSWHASMLDPDSYPAPETSSTGLIGYALWWGMNNGYLDESFLPHAEAAWQVMLKAQHKDGMLGYVQPIGADPREVTADMTEVYGAAAMELMAIQIMEHNRLQAGVGRLPEAQCLLSNDPMVRYDELAQNRQTMLSQWEFRRGDSDKWQTVTLPHSCNAIDGQSEHYYRGDAFYRTTIDVSEEYSDNYLLFKQVAQRATVYVNGHEVIDHFGGYTPFTVDISPYVHPGENEILVRTNNAMDLTMAPVSSDFNKNNGLHGEVFLLETGNLSVNTRLAGYRGMLVSTPEVSADMATVTIRTYLSAVQSQSAIVRAYLREADGRIVAQAAKQVAVEPASSSALSLATDLSMQITNPHLWNGLADPYRYTVELIVEDDSCVYEHRTARIGIRTVEARKDGFYLNGKLYPLRGFSYHQDKYLRASALTRADIDHDFRLIQELGCNMLRIAHYPHSEYTFDCCDSLGILVQTEIPWVNECGADTSAYNQALYGEHLLQAWDEMIRGRYNHPSIAFWGMWNELGGSHANRPQGDLDKAFLVRMTDTLYRTGKALDPYRIIGFADMGFGMSIPELQLGRNYDYFGCNKYIGWYQDQQRPENVAGLGGFMDHIHRNWGPCAITEYGAGGSPYCHSVDPVATTQPATGGARHDEEWFSTLHEIAVAQIKARPWLLFTSAWVLCDFAVADRREGYITCTDGITEGVDSTKLFINDKGIITRDRSLKKDAFYLYKAWWNPQPTVYIAERRFTSRPTDSVAIKVYSNAQSLTLYQNGQTVQTLTTSGESTGLIWRFDAVPFESDADEFRVEGSYTNGLKVTDAVRFSHHGRTY